MTRPTAEDGGRPGRLASVVGTAFALGTFLAGAVLLTPAHLLSRLRRSDSFRITRIFHSLVCRALRVRVVVSGQAGASRPTLYVSNHVSWLDIYVLGSLLSGAFVAKSEVRRWPLVGALARLQPTVFVDRDDRRGARRQSEALARALGRHGGAILFAEGTSSDGSAVLPFKSALFAALDQAPGLMIQPVSLAYTELSGVAVSAANRDRVAWYADMTLAPHLFLLAGESRVGAAVEFHPPFLLNGPVDRKALAKRCEAAVRAGHARLIA